MSSVADLIVAEELGPLEQIASLKGWQFKRLSSTSFELGLPAKDGTMFWLLCEYTGYTGMPPAWHWYNPASKAVDQPEDTPTGGGYFHDQGVICAPWNRLAYKSEDERGPHSDWTIGNWKSNSYTKGCKTLSAMALRIATELMGDNFKGRKGTRK